MCLSLLEIRELFTHALKRGNLFYSYEKRHSPSQTLIKAKALHIQKIMKQRMAKKYSNKGKHEISIALLPTLKGKHGNAGTEPITFLS